MQDLRLVKKVELYRFYRAVSRYPGELDDWSLGEYVALRSLLLLSRLKEESQRDLYPTLIRSIFRELHAYAGEFVFFGDSLKGFYPTFLQLLLDNLQALGVQVEASRFMEIWEESQEDPLLLEMDRKILEALKGGDPWNLEEKKIFQLALKMKRTSRYSGIVLITPDRLLDHTYEVSLLAALMSLSIPESSGDASLDPGLVLLKALVHDVDEAVFGDVVRPVKYGVPGLKEFLDGEAERYLQGNFPYLSGIWSRSKKGESGALVKLSDLLSVLLEVTEEVKLGSTYIFQATQKYPYYMESLAGEFRSRRGAIWSRLAQLAEEAAETYRDLERSFL